MWIEFLNNPIGRRVGDCAVRAISKALNMGWEAAYIALVMNGLQMGDISEDLEKLMNKTDDERVKDEIRRLMEKM